MSKLPSDSIDKLVATLREKGHFVRTYMNKHGVVEYHQCHVKDNGDVVKVITLQDETVRALEKAGRLYQVSFIQLPKNTMAFRVII